MLLELQDLGFVGDNLFTIESSVSRGGKGIHCPTMLTSSIMTQLSNSLSLSMQKAQKDSYADHHNNCWLGNFAFSTTRHYLLDLKDRAKNKIEFNCFICIVPAKQCHRCCVWFTGAGV
jgi:hypothetical protein